MILIFAFASNLDPVQMRARCPSARLRGRATLLQHELAFVGHSARWGGAVATVHRASGKTVLGALYEMTVVDRAVLDAYEGGYIRVTRQVACSRALVRADLYVRPFANVAQPSPAYLEAIGRGYRSLGYSLTSLLPYRSET